MAAVALPPRARSRQGQHGAGPGPGLPDFETLLASGGSTIRVRASEDRRHASDDEDGGEDKDDEELLEDDPPTPPRKSAPHPSTAAMAGRISSPRSAAPGGSGAAIKGREAALRDIEREMALDEVDEEDDGAGSYASEVESQLEQPIQPGPGQEKAITGTLSSNTHRLSGTAPLPSSSNPDKALPMSPPDMVEHDLRRRSQYRSPGLATSPDLATLVKTAKASNGQIPVGRSPQQPPALDSAFTGTSSQHQLPTSTSPAATLRGPGSPRSRVSSESGTRRQYTPTLTTVSSLQAAMDLPRARAVSTRSDSGTSFVHVNQQPPAAPMRISSLTTVPSSGPHTASKPPTMPDSDLGTVTSVWSGGSASTSRRTKKLTKGGGDENSISNAMRKTSGFFKKTFGSKDTSSSTSRPPSTLSVPNTPTSVRFSTYDSPSKPPVPLIPPAYAQSTPTRRASTDTASPRTTGRQSRSSSQVSKTSPTKSLGRFSSFAASFRSSDNRSTSDLSNSVPPVPNHISPQRSFSGMKASTSTQSTEQERLARELDQWQGYEQSLEMLAPDAVDENGDVSVNTIKGRSSTSSRGGGRTSIPETPPQASRTRSRSNSAAGSGVILMSGSIPSPHVPTRSPRPSNPDTFFMSGSIPSPQQAQRRFQAANGTSSLGGSLKGSPSIGSPSARSPPETQARFDGTRTSDDRVKLSPAGGKQVRKRSTSTSTSPTSSPLLGEDRNQRNPTVRLVSSPPSQSQEASEQSVASIVPPYRKASIGLGLAMEGDQDSPARKSTEERNRSFDSDVLSPVRPNDIPRLLTQSPSPAPSKISGQGVSSAYASPTPARTSSMKAATSPSSPALEASTSSLPPDSDTAKSFADRCWNEDESFLKKEKIAEWLGGNGAVNQAALAQYMQNFNFRDLSLELAFRRLCEKLYLRAETQQVDRILAAFSARYLEENPDTIFQTKDIVHAVTYAMLLLNTDLHVADVTSRMSRSDFIANTMSAIHAQNSNTPSIGTKTPASSHSPAIYGTNGFFQADGGRHSLSEQLRDGSTTARYRPKRSGSASANSSKTGVNDLANFAGSSTNLPMQSPPKETPEAGEGLPSSIRGDSLPNGTGRAWEAEVEGALKEIYTAVRSRAIMQPLAYSQLAPPSSNGSPYNSWNGSINRTPSRRSQASLTGMDRSIASKRTSIRGLLGASHESLRATSPTPSVGTSMSGGNFSGITFGSTMSNATSYYPATMGFASNLSHTIIKEQQEHEDDALSENSDGSTSDEELALLGAPWAKEGILQRKHYWETPNKRSKDKHWLQVFAVISKGEMKMFQFGGSAGASSFGGGVGGGNWLTNANMVGEVPLAHSLSSAMPPPGYNRSRPHVLVLTLATGGSYFFQAGTEDLVNEWVLTCNYWAGRTSREPLLGGVSNMDYGWNRVSGRGGDSQEDTEDLVSVRSGRSGHSRRSKISYTGSLSRQHGLENPADRQTIFDWRPPQPPSGFSTLSEDAQFDALRKHTLALQTELERHNDLRLPMLKLYTPRSINSSKAAANWEKKSKYLLAELVKYQTYVEALKAARLERQKRRDEKQVNRLLEEADHNAGLGDPAYLPEMDTTTETFATHDTSRDTVESAVDDIGLSVGDTSRGTKENGPRRNRFSANTASTNGDFFEAHDGRTSTDV